MTVVFDGVPEDRISVEVVKPGMETETQTQVIWLELYLFFLSMSKPIQSPFV